MPDAIDERPLSARALRFSRLMKGEALPGFADLQRQRRVDRFATTQREEIAALVALLDSRKAIDAELNGSRLGPIAIMVGEARFDEVCEARIDPSIYSSGTATLPPPNALTQRGEELMQGVERSKDVALLVEIAATICAQTPCMENAA